MAVLDRIADILGAQGDTDPADLRRATALGILANPAEALALLTQATLEGPDATGSPAEPAGYHVDGTGKALGAASYFVRGDPFAETDPDPTAASPLYDDLLGGSRLAPAVNLHVHISAESLAAREGVARVEGVGPHTLGRVKDWLGAGARSIQVRPVLDPAGLPAVDRYEVPTPMREAVLVKQPYEAFPFGTLLGRHADDDHINPYRAHGPPDQTRPDNLVPLSRRHHRMKTHGRWVLRRVAPDVLMLRTPHGHWLRVDACGTTYHGRDEALDAKLLQSALQAS